MAGLEMISSTDLCDIFREVSKGYQLAYLPIIIFGTSKTVPSGTSSNIVA